MDNRKCQAVLNRYVTELSEAIGDQCRPTLGEFLIEPHQQCLFTANMDLAGQVTIDNEECTSVTRAVVASKAIAACKDMIGLLEKYCRCLKYHV